MRSWTQTELGLTFGPWQGYTIDKVLRFDTHGDLVHRSALFSTGRQNGKSVIVRGFFGWLLDVGRTIGPFAEWTDIRSCAHDGKQARIPYRSVFLDLQSIPRLTATTASDGHSKVARPPVNLTKHYGIETDSLFFDILSSEDNAARGLSIGALAFDEVLTQRDYDMWAAVTPTQTSQRSPIRLLTSSAGHADSVVLRDHFERMVRQASGDERPTPAFYGVWWQTSTVDVGYDAAGVRRPLTRDDWAELLKANPGLTEGRPRRAAIEEEHATFPREKWQRERLNHFVDAVADSILPPGAWGGVQVVDPLGGVTGPLALGVSVTPGWERATIAVAAIRDDGRIGVEVYRDMRVTEGDTVSAATLIDALAGFPAIDQVLSIAVDNQSAAAPALHRHHETAGLPYDFLGPAQVTSACMDVTERILSRELAVDDPLLTAQIGSVARRAVGQDGAFRFSTQHSTGPIDAVWAMTFAAHSIAYFGGGPLIG